LGYLKQLLPRFVADIVVIQNRQEALTHQDSHFFSPLMFRHKRNTFDVFASIARFDRLA